MILLDFTDYALDKWPVLTICLVAIGVVIYVAVWVTRFYYTHIKAVEDKVEHADCKRHGDAISGFDKKTEKMFARIDESLSKIGRIENLLGGRITTLEKAFIAKYPEQLDTFAQHNSPLQLNDFSKEIMEESGADKIFEQQKDDLVRRMEELKPGTAYDVEETAYRVLLYNSSEMWFNPIKTFLYNNPVYKEKTLNVDILCFIMSLPLRDYYLARHPEISA